MPVLKTISQGLIDRCQRQFIQSPGFVFLYLHFSDKCVTKRHLEDVFVRLKLSHNSEFTYKNHNLKKYICILCNSSAILTELGVSCSL
jgi:hypothetical protein